MCFLLSVRGGAFGLRLLPKTKLRELIKRFLSLLTVAALLLLFAGAAVFCVRAAEFDLSSVPAFSGEPYAVINGNEPSFDESRISPEPFESYGKPDRLGRCTAAFACVGTETMPTSPRGSISSVRPTGWQNDRYDIVDGGALYNRCHLIAYQLTAENANKRNLITGTRYMNTEGMQPFEESVAAFISGSGYHVLYRVTPLFAGDELVARGVLMEALSVEDGGAGVRFCVFCYNVQPGVVIDYASGESRLTDPDAGEIVTAAPTAVFILNIRSKIFHLPDCDSVSKMSAKNKRESVDTAASLIGAGYKPCSVCRPDKASVSAGTPGESSAPFGDVDGDGIVTAADARAALRIAVRLDAADDKELRAADVDGDADVTAADARLILCVAVGLIINTY